MRIVLIAVIMLFITSAKAQFYTPLNSLSLTQPGIFTSNHIKDSITNKKWFFTTYTGISTSFIFNKGGNATVFSAPVSLQLNRELNKNLYAFASVSAAPAFINFNNAFLSANANKFNQNSFYNPNNLGIYSSANLGLMYVNDAKTFSISGSIGVERSSYPFPYNQPNNTQKQNPANTPYR